MLVNGITALSPLLVRVRTKRSTPSPPAGAGRPRRPAGSEPRVRSLTVDPKTRMRIVSGTLVLLLVVVLISSLAGR